MLDAVVHVCLQRREKYPFEEVSLDSASLL